MSQPKYIFPAFDDLPSVPEQPQGCLWGFFDRNGEKDQLGALNLLTADVVKEAAKEIQTGKHIQLDWPLQYTEFPGYGRIACQHKVKDLAPEGFVAFDDEIHINTQTSSQWDGLKHFGIQKQGLYYNGLTHEEAATTTKLGIHNICDRGGIVGRAILIDWLSWWEEQNPGKQAPSPVSTYGIPIQEIEAALQKQGTVSRQGDILIVRTGFIRWYHKATDAEKASAIRENHDFLGVASNEQTVRWLYDHHFSAVAGDAMGFEAWPFPSDCCLHEWLLCQWGTSIGELWQLEELSEECKRLGRWSFFLTSAPLRVIGGIASPPNVIAIL